VAIVDHDHCRGCRETHFISISQLIAAIGELPRPGDAVRSRCEAVATGKYRGSHFDTVNIILRFSSSVLLARSLIIFPSS
jgi:hypothetical protein